MKKYLKNIGILAITSVSFSSCLKDKVMIGPDASGAIKNIIEFKNIGGIKSTPTAPYALFVPLTLNPADATASFDAVINYAGTDVAPSDITVNLAADPAVLTTYNTKVAGANYSPIAASSISFPSSVTIKKGEREAKVKIVVKPSTFDASKENAIGLKITSTSAGVISGNFGAVIYSMPLKSIWQGIYTVRFNNHFGTIDANIGNFVEPDIKLETVGPNKLQVQYVNYTYNGYTQYQFSGDNSTITGVTVFSGSIRASSINSVDLVDPVNKNFTLTYTWLGRGVTETWTRTGDLP